MDAQRIPDSLLIDEIRLNRTAIERVENKLDGKVGRGELFGWLGATITVASLIVRAAI